MRRFLVLWLVAILVSPLRGEITPIPRVVAVGEAGSMLVVPVRLSDPRDRLGVPICRFEIGEPTEIELVWFSIRPGEGVRTPLSAWLGLDRTWRTIASADAGAGDGQGFWALCIRVPSGARGSLWIDQRLVRVRRYGGETSGVMGGVPEIEVSGDLLAALRIEAGDPFWFWHARLADPRFEQSGFADEKLSGWGEGLAGAWGAGLRDLRESDPDLARSLAGRLWRVARVEGPSEWPMWPQSAAALSELLEILLDPAREGDARARRVRAWLDEQDRVLSWMLGPPAPGVGATAALLNLSESSEIAWVWDVGDGVATPMELPAGQMTPVLLGDGSGAGDGWEIRMNGRTMPIVTAPGAVALGPPGGLLGPLLADWTLEDLQGTGGSSEGGVALRAMLFRVPRDLGGRGPDEGIEPGVVRRYEERAAHVWRLHIEGLESAGAVVRVWLGEMGSASHVLRVSSEGWVIDERAGGVKRAIDVARRGDRWAMQVDLPADADGGDGMLHLGLEWLDARGRRWSWPAARMPWDSEPARTVFDSRSWLGIPGG